MWRDLLSTESFGQPSGATGTVIGGHSCGGPWYQLMLWRYGVPRLFKAVPAHGYARLVGRIGHLVRHRGAFLVVVRVDPSDQIDAPTSRLWEFGPFPREKATGVRDGLGKAIDEGRWVPLARS